MYKYDASIKLEVGTKNGMLTILELKYKKYKGQDWYSLCKCDCGNLCLNKRGDLRVVSDRTPRNCGCVGRYNSKPKGEANLNRVVDGYKGSARHRKISWDLTDEEAKQLLLAKCFYCNTLPSRIYKRVLHSNGDAIVNGIDRLDNTIGYTTLNVVSCCKFCNIAKGTLSLERFILNIKKLYENLSLEQDWNIVSMANNITGVKI